MGTIEEVFYHYRQSPTHDLSLLEDEVEKTFDEQKKIWYSKLLAKLIEIQKGDRDLNEYKKEIEEKINPLNK